MKEDNRLRIVAQRCLDSNELNKTGVKNLQKIFIDLLEKEDGTKQQQFLAQSLQQRDHRVKNSKAFQKGQAFLLFDDSTEGQRLTALYNRVIPTAKFSR